MYLFRIVFLFKPERGYGRFSPIQLRTKHPNVFEFPDMKKKGKDLKKIDRQGTNNL